MRLVLNLNNYSKMGHDLIFLSAIKHTTNCNFVLLSGYYD